MSVSRLAATSLVALLGLATPAVAPSALADVITGNPTGTFTTSGGGFALGQSVTTGAGGPWNTLSFSFFSSPGPTPYAFGTLFLLSQPYAGTPASLSSAAAGYIADTSTITAGAWDFDDAVTLQASTQYFLYMAGAVSPAPLLFSNANPYAGGGTYQSTSPSSDPYFAIPGGTVDLVFTLQGNTATATPEPASALLLAPALLALLRSRRPTP